MTIVFEQRASDSPYIESVTHGYTVSNGRTIRPVEYCWHMVFVKENSSFHPIIAGPFTSAGDVSWGKDAEVLWLKFKPGVFMPHLPFSRLLNSEIALPEATGQAFWLKSATWASPTFENAEVFVNRLIKDEILVRDSVVSAVLQGQPHDMAPRTVRHRFQRATGQTQKQIQQARRALQASTLLQNGATILDTAYQLGYTDQSHLTHALKLFVGHTPGQLTPQKNPA
ncbi:MAG: helix-turn-helix transcriptional regulator [Ardenticatenaceae bacterium]|nr:helix-turn-helix transcriptional regulator [Ardenticatenaceae bacterium]